VKTAVFLLLLPAVWSQPLRLYSEFAKIDATGKVTAPAEPREILSPAIARNAFSSFQVVVDVPRGTTYQLYVAQNPENAVEVTLYRENGDRLERVEQPVSGNSTQVFWMDLWTARDAPVARIKVEPQLHVNNDWVIYPMEARVMEATVPDSKKTDYSDFCKSVTPAMRSRSGTVSVSGFQLRNMELDIALASLAPAQGRFIPCDASDPDDPERYLPTRDYLLRLR
jgi:hypothetical protein